MVDFLKFFVWFIGDVYFYCFNFMYGFFVERVRRRFDGFRRKRVRREVVMGEDFFV